MNETASNFVGEVPKYYESGLVPVIFEDYAKDLAVRATKGSPLKVLELACGTGVVTRLLFDRLGRKGELVASDLNLPMLELARNKFSKRESVEFQPVDAMQIPFEPSTFDTIACQFGVMFFPDKVASYQEALRVLKPGGCYVFNVWDSQKHNPFAAIAQQLVEEVFPEDPPGFYHVPFHYHDPKQIISDLEAAGFSSVKVKRKRITKKFSSVETFARGLVFGNPLDEEIRNRGGDSEAVFEELKSRFQKAFGSERPRMPLSALVITAVNKS